MATASLRIDGLEQLRADLRRLPADLSAEAFTIVQRHGQAAEGDVLRRYPRGPTGNLRAGVSLTVRNPAVGARVELYSRAPHAWMYDHGTKDRVTLGHGPKHKYRAGVHRGRLQPQSPEIFVPTAIRERQAMYGDLARMLETHGFDVSAYSGFLSV